jgi:glycine cleavage system transcriptional repressor
MQYQLIVTILGADRVGILCQLVESVSHTGCSILDSRQAIYGEDFSLTMILQGSAQAINRAEFSLPQICQQLDLLSMMKRTQKHAKQNLESMADVNFYGTDAVGLMAQITAFFSQHKMAITALRQKRSVDSGKEIFKCKLVVSMPTNQDFIGVYQAFTHLLEELNLSGNMTQH